MARRHRSSPTVSLFPFLSILSCVIGTLTLLIAGLTVGEMSPPPEDLSRNLDRIQAQQSGLEKKKLDLEDLIAKAEEVVRMLAAAREELARLEELKSKSAEDQAAIVKLLARINKLRERIAQLEIETSEREKRLAAANADLEKQQETNRRARDRVMLRPAGSGHDRIPAFVECFEKGLILNPDQKSIRRYVGLDGIASSEKLRALCNSIKSRPKWIVTFLIRPGGVKSFEKARDAAEKTGVKYGYCPVPGHMILDFELFESIKKAKS